jgi:hypothetical protein
MHAAVLTPTPTPTGARQSAETCASVRTSRIQTVPAEWVGPGFDSRAGTRNPWYTVAFASGALVAVAKAFDTQVDAHDWVGFGSQVSLGREAEGSRGGLRRP